MHPRVLDFAFPRGKLTFQKDKLGSNYKLSDGEMIRALSRLDYLPSAAPL
jgi:hypothetical protein